MALPASAIDGKGEVTLALSPLPRVKCRPQQLSAVFSNLLRNAVAAIAPGGHITIRSGESHGAVVLEVQDDGRGIPPERLAHLFDPMFRVEKGRVGTSWGLFVSRSIVSEHGGHLEIASTPGEGTTARILLPLPLAEAA